MYSGRGPCSLVGGLGFLLGDACLHCTEATNFNTTFNLIRRLNGHQHRPRSELWLQRLASALHPPSRGHPGAAGHNRSKQLDMSPHPVAALYTVKANSAKQKLTTPSPMRKFLRTLRTIASCGMLNIVEQQVPSEVYTRLSSTEYLAGFPIINWWYLGTNRSRVSKKGCEFACSQATALLEYQAVREPQQVGRSLPAWEPRSSESHPVPRRSDVRCHAPLWPRWRLWSVQLHLFPCFQRPESTMPLLPVAASRPSAPLSTGIKKLWVLLPEHAVIHKGIQL